MHIPDGFISPKTYIPLYIVSGGLLSFGFYKLKKDLNEETIPKIAILTAISFVLMSLAVPIPGGTSAHGVGAALFSILLGPWISFICLTLCLIIQTFVFGMGGITSLPVNSLALGFIGSFSSYFIYIFLKKLNEKLAIFFAGYLSLIFSAIFIGFILGLQPIISKTPEGKPLFFPFGFEIVLPALIIPHLLFGFGEGAITLTLILFFRKFKFDKR